MIITRQDHRSTSALKCDAYKKQQESRSPPVDGIALGTATGYCGFGATWPSPLFTRCFSCVELSVSGSGSCGWLRPKLS